MSRRRRIVALTVLLSTLVLGGPGAGAASADAGELGVVTVLRQPGGGAVSVVAEVQPAPPVALPADAAQVTVDGANVPATTAPLLDPGAATAIVLDASDDGREALPQALSGAAAFLLRLPTTTPVTAIADATPPKNLTTAPVSPVDALQLIAGVRAGGDRSTSAALDLALKGLPRSAGGRSLLLLETNGSAPQDAAGLSDRLHSAGVVLAVVTNTNLVAAWTPIARATGGLAVGAAPRDVAGAFDDVAQTLQSRSVVTFTPPSGATSASLRVRAGGDVLPAQVPLASGAPAASPKAPATPQSGTPSAPFGGFGWLIAAVLAGLVLLAVGTAVLVRRRGSPSRDVVADGDRPAEVRVGEGAGTAGNADDRAAAEVVEDGGRPAEVSGRPAEVAEDAGGPADVVESEVLEGEVLEHERADEGVAADGDERPAEVLQGEVVEPEVVEGEGAAAEVSAGGEHPADGVADQAAAAEVAPDDERPAEEGAAPEVAADDERPAEVAADEGEGVAHEVAPDDQRAAEEGEDAAREVAGDDERPAEEGEGAAEEVPGGGERPTEVDESQAAAAVDGEHGAASDLPREEASASPAVEGSAIPASDGEAPPRVRVFDVTDPTSPVEIKSPQAGDTGEGSGYVGHHRKGRHRPRLRLKPRQEDEEPGDPSQRDRSA